MSVVVTDKQHDKVCRSFLGFFVGKVVEVNFINQASISGLVKKEGRNYYIGGEKLNGELVSSVYPRY